tara:strand:- start:2187 stop:2873 length:687 start_codon:yes stop_codon:yes gene_type:complete
MSLLGNGAMVVWCDSTAPDDHDDWHSHEHLSERLSVPGFRRGRRGVATDGEPRYVVIYEVDDLSVLTSQPYLDRLNNPTPWTRRSLPTLRNVNRSLCSVTASFGSGIGTHLLTINLAPEPERATDLKNWLVNETLPGLSTRAGVVGASLLECDRIASQVDTEEKRQREAPDAIADWILLIEGYDPSSIQSLTQTDLSPARLAGFGGSTDHTACYHVSHILTDRDVASQ